MADVIVCDTNAVIQLAIICPKSLTSGNSVFRLVVHSIVKQEIHQLRRNPEEEARLGGIFDFISKSVPGGATLAGLSNPQNEAQQHRMIKRFEQTLPPNQISAGSSHIDRRFLILARANQAKLLTNEGTLFNLAAAFLKPGHALRLSDVIEALVENNIVSRPDIQAGLNALATHGEALRADCADRIRSLGFTVS